MTPWRPLLIGAALLSTACAHRSTAPVRGPGSAVSPFYRSWPGGDKVYVEVDLGDGEPRMMLLDTGAGITLLTPEVAEELGLVLSEDTDVYMQVSGTLEARSAVIPQLDLGRHTVRNVHVAVPTRPVHDRAGGVPFAGLLGNNVLSHFQLVVDYPANRVELHRRSGVELPDDAAPLYFDGQHAMTGVVVVGRRDGQTVEEEVLVDVDTGARGVWLFGALSEPFADLASEGLEPVVGVSSGAGLPLRAMMQLTRRIPLIQVHAGGTVVEREIEAVWTSYDGEPTDLAAATPGLIGHAVLDGYRAVMDYPAQRFALLPPATEREENDIHAWRLKTLRKSRAEDRLVRMAELYLWMDQAEDAVDVLERHHRKRPEDPEGGVFLARMWRNDGRIEEALALLEGYTPAQLVEHGEIVALSNALWLEDRLDEALALATAATQAEPEAPGAWVALSDVRRAAGDLSGARSALVTANRLAENPDGNLLRRAWLAAWEGDSLAAQAHLRRDLELHPGGTIAPWFYGRLVGDEDERAQLRADLDRAAAKLHPGEGGLDFMAVGYHYAGDQERALELSRAGIERDCEGLEVQARADNCRAWYTAIIGTELDEARRRIDAALEALPGRPEFLDTRSVVLEQQGDLEGARDASWQAARAEPQDVYLLWQASRLDAALAPDSPPAAEAP